MNFFKKLMSFTLVAVAVCSLGGVAGCSNEAKLVFEKIEGKEEYAVVDIQTPNGVDNPQDVTIPAEYNGLPVTKVVLSASDYVSVVRMPSSVTHMEGAGWYSTGTLKELHVDSVKSYLEITYSNYDFSISGWSYWDLYVGDTLVTEIKFDGMDYQKEYITGLSGCQSIEKIDFMTGGENRVPAANITSLGELAHCKNLKEIILPSTVREIGAYAFNDCTSLAKVEMNTSVTEIGAHAFEGCVSLQEFKIPYSAKAEDVAADAFLGCTGIKKISYPAGRTYQAVENLKKSNAGMTLVTY